jgi:hypothetical protein
MMLSPMRHGLGMAERLGLMNRRLGRERFCFANPLDLIDSKIRSKILTTPESVTTLAESLDGVRLGQLEPDCTKPS